jgi:hypothetical protein
MLRYFEDLRDGLESLKTAPQTDDGRKEVFELKRQIVRTLVHRGEIKRAGRFARSCYMFASLFPCRLTGSPVRAT